MTLHSQWRLDGSGGTASTKRGHRRSLLAALWRAQEGATAIEFAIVAPLLILVMAGILGHGFYFAVIHHVQQLTAEAARASVAGLTPAERRQIVTETVDKTISAYSLLKRERVMADVTPSATDPGLYEVTITYDASHLPIWSLEGVVPLPSPTIRRSSSVRPGGD